MVCFSLMFSRGIMATASTMFILLLLMTVVVPETAFANPLKTTIILDCSEDIGDEDLKQGAHVIQTKTKYLPTNWIDVIIKDKLHIRKIISLTIKNCLVEHDPTLYNNLRRIPNLRILNLYNLGLTSFNFGEIGNLIKLKKVSFDDNLELSELENPKTLRLEKMSLRNTGFHEFPAEALHQFKHLKLLEIDNTNAPPRRTVCSIVAGLKRFNNEKCNSDVPTTNIIDLEIMDSSDNVDSPDSKAKRNSGHNTHSSILPMLVLAASVLNSFATKLIA